MLVYRKNQAGWSDMLKTLPPSLHLPRGIWQLAINDTVSIVSYMDANNQVGHVDITGDAHAVVKRALLERQMETLN